MPTANSADIYAKMAKKVRQFGGLLISPGFVRIRQAVQCMAVHQQNLTRIGQKNHRVVFIIKGDADKVT
ncbi:MAG: hypothetical protein KUL81_09170 [Azonexus sp.]|nr:hypothetical protein [Azonexus sp.]